VEGTTATELNPLLRYRLAGGVQALSVDASGRFVAALGKPSQKSCPASLGGRPLNIWARDQKSSLPVASTCLTGRHIASIGPLRQVKGLWELDVFEFDAADAKSPVKKSPYICLACGLAAVDLKDPGSSELAERALGFKPIELKREALKSAYGIEL